MTKTPVRLRAERMAKELPLNPILVALDEEDGLEGVILYLEKELTECALSAIGSVG